MILSVSYFLIAPILILHYDFFRIPDEGRPLQKLNLIALQDFFDALGQDGDDLILPGHDPFQVGPESAFQVNAQFLGPVEIAQGPRPWS